MATYTYDEERPKYVEEPDYAPGIAIVWHGSDFFNKDKEIKIKEESVSMKIDKYRTQEARYKYLAIDEMPILFLIPIQDSNESLPIEKRISNLSYSMKNDDLVRRAYFLHVLDWVRKHANSNPFLKFLSNILDITYEKIQEKVSNDIVFRYPYKELYNELKDVFHAGLEALKPIFFDFYYYQDKDIVIKNNMEKVLQDLNIKAHKDYKNMSLKDMYEVYNKNKEVREKIEQLIQEEIEKRWIEFERTSFYVICNEINEAITRVWKEKHDVLLKTIYIMYHEALLSLAYINGYRDESTQTLFFVIKIDEFGYEFPVGIGLKYHSLILIMYAPKHVLNWAFGTFSIINRLYVLKQVDSRFEFGYKYRDPEWYYKKAHNVHSIEPIYGGNYLVSFKNVSFDFLEPNIPFPKFSAKHFVDLIFNRKKMPIILKSYIQILGMLTRFGLFVLKMYNRVFKSDLDINNTCLLGHGCLLPINGV